MKNSNFVRPFLLLGILSLSFVLVAGDYIVPEKMIVISDNVKSLKNTGYAQSRLSNRNKSLEIYYLDDVAALEEKLSEGLPDDEDSARKVFEERLSIIGKTKFEEQVIKSYRGLFVAFKQKINHYPAIIFDDNSIIYGVTDLKVALQKYRDWKYQNREVK